MRILLYTCIIFQSVIGYGQNDSLLCEGKVLNAHSLEPVEGAKVMIWQSYSISDSSNTNQLGVFRIDISSESNFFVTITHPSYIEKTIHISNDHLTTLSKLKFRERVYSNSVSDIDSTIIGKKVKTLMNTYNMDRDDLEPIFEPPLICRGFRFELGDSTSVNVFIERSVARMSDINKTFKNKILGISIAPLDGKVQIYGDGKPLVCPIENKYK